jgi:purine-nucleoside phosphorylase
MRGQIAEAAEFVLHRAGIRPRVGVVCGSGMGALADAVENRVDIPYGEIPHFPLSTVHSHAGNLVLGNLAGRAVCLMQGRFHFYEGYELSRVIFPHRVMRACGCEVLILTNAVGSMNPRMNPGHLVFIDDHIDFFMGENPLLGPNDETLGLRFPDMSRPYDEGLIRLGEDVALRAGVPCFRGVMLGGAGPNLETRAEYRMFRSWGADIVGMSTVPETVAARHCGMRVLGISTVTNQCNPDTPTKATHEQVVAVADAAGPRLRAVVSGTLERLDEALCAGGKS